MSEWKVLKTLQEVAAAQAAGDEIQREVDYGWERWNGAYWSSMYNLRSRPKQNEVIQLRKGLFGSPSAGYDVRQCTEQYAEGCSNFVQWLTSTETAVILEK